MSELLPEEVTALEKKIIDHPDRLDLYQIYGDYLQSQGDLRGQLIAVQLELARMHAIEKAEESLSIQCRELVLGPLSAYAEQYGEQVSVTTRFGFLDSVAFDLDNRALSGAKLVGLLTRLVDHSSAQFLSELAFTCNPRRWTSTSERMATIIEVLTAVGKPQSLRRLCLGPPLTNPEYNRDSELVAMLHSHLNPQRWDNRFDLVANLEALPQVFARLESIRVGIPAAVGDMQWPRVRSLALLCCYDHHLTSLTTARCPELTRLMLGFLADDALSDDLLAALSQLGPGWPKLRSLTLVNCPAMACIQLLQSPLVEQLTSMAIRADHDAGPRIGQYLIENPERLTGLNRLKLVTTLSADMAQALSSSPLNVDLTGCVRPSRPSGTAHTEESRSHQCSFCGKSRWGVRKLISGPGVFICDECVGLCLDIIAEEIEDSSDPPETVIHREFEDEI